MALRTYLYLSTTLLVPTAFAQSETADCTGAIELCDTTMQTIVIVGDNGSMQDLNSTNRGCLVGGEYAGVWLKFRTSSLSPENGTLAFHVNGPTNSDLDFAIWGPYYDPPGSGPEGSLDWTGVENVCPPAQNPIRCSFSSAAGPTGLGYDSALPTSVGAGGPSFVRHLTTGPGQVYLLYVDDHSVTGVIGSLSWPAPPEEYQPMAILACDGSTGITDRGIAPLFRYDALTEMVHVQMDNASAFDWRLYDIHGRLLRNGRTGASEAHHMVADVPMGSYMLQLSTPTQQHHWRFVKY